MFMCRVVLQDSCMVTVVMDGNTVEHHVTITWVEAVMVMLVAERTCWWSRRLPSLLAFLFIIVMIPVVERWEVAGCSAWSPGQYS